MPASPLILRRLIALVVFAVVLAACDSGATPSPSPVGDVPSALAGTAWIVQSVNGRAPIAGAVPTIMFDDTSVTGTGGCNHLGGHYQYDAASGSFAVADLGMTAMGCLQPGVTDYETTFVQALGTASHAGTGPDGELVLDGPAGRVLLVHLEHP